MTSGPALFSRFAYPPNSLGYCGPSDGSLLGELISNEADAALDFRHAIEAFAGAWPYLELIAGCAGRDPLDAEVIEAYWLGNGLLHRVDTLIWGNSLDDRFRSRAGGDWERMVAGINGGGSPNHAFHVFCAYPWVGLLRSGSVEQALTVLDRCRIRWGTVVGAIEDRLLVESQPLEWDGEFLRLGAARVESVAASVDDDATAAAGDLVALHWDYICQRITDRQLTELVRNHTAHLALANRHGSRMAARIDN